MFYKLLETSVGYRLNRWVGTSTANALISLLDENVGRTFNGRILELGCGLGHFREYLAGDYYGIDINPSYVKTAQKSYPGHFSEMDCTSLKFENDFFDRVVSFVTFHHLTPSQVEQTIKEAFRVCKNKDEIHIFDAILPLDPKQRFKRQLFRMDRGRFQRSKEEHLSLLGRCGKILKTSHRDGLLHDVLYARLSSS